jgi:hypothetical protein
MIPLTVSYFLKQGNSIRAGIWQSFLYGFFIVLIYLLLSLPFHFLDALKEKPSFREANRCLVPADGFFEWQWLDVKGKQKQKFKLGIADEALFMFAGLWDAWPDRETGEIIHSFALVTTAAKGIMKEIHNSKLRMPLVLNPNEETLWLEGAPVFPFKNFEARPV